MVKKQSHNLLFAASLAFVQCLISPAGARAAAADQARLTKIVDDVQIVLSPVSRKAALNDDVGPETPVRTGANSWAELTFTNHAIARLTQNTLLSFKRGTRELDFAEGAVLLDVPRTARGAKVKMADVAAEVTKTTCLCEFRSGTYKFLVLQGTARLYRPGHLGDSILVQPGQMVIGKAGTALSDPVDVDIERFSHTSHFLLDFPELSSAKLIARESDTQQRNKTRRRLIGTNLVIFGGGTSVSLVNPKQMNGSAASSASPQANPSGSEDLGSIEAPPPSATSGAPAVLRSIETSTSTGRP